MIVGGNLSVGGNTTIGDASTDTFTFNPTTFETAQDILYIQKTSSAREVHIFTATGWSNWTPAAYDIVYLVGTWTGTSKTVSVNYVTITGKALIQTLTVSSNTCTINDLNINNLTVSGQGNTINGCQFYSGTSITISNNNNIITNCHSSTNVSITGSNCKVISNIFDSITISGSYNNIVGNEYTYMYCDGNYNTITSNNSVRSLTNISSSYTLTTIAGSYNNFNNNTIIISVSGTSSGTIYVLAILASCDYGLVNNNIIKVDDSSSGGTLTGRGILTDAGSSYTLFIGNNVQISGFDTNTAISIASGTGNSITSYNITS
jgi:hypothetical protein